MEIDLENNNELETTFSNPYELVKYECKQGKVENLYFGRLKITYWVE